MPILVKKRLSIIKKASLKEKNKIAYQNAIESIENDEEFIKLYNMTVQKYLDAGKNPNNITFNEIIDLDFDYFASSYGVKFFIIKNKNDTIDFYEI